MSGTPRYPAIMVIALALAAGALGGCGFDDIELNGGIFDAIGINAPSEKAEPKLAQRGPLVVPPTVASLPQPGTPAEAQAADVTAAINDPDRKAVVDRSELERQQAAYCKEHYDLAKARGDTNADDAVGPLGPCRPSVLTAIKQWNGEPAPEGQQQ